MTERLKDIVYLLNARRRTPEQVQKLEEQDGKAVAEARLNIEQHKWATKDRRTADAV